jgi:hypothetical protein
VSDPRDYKLDISSSAGDARGADPSPRTAVRGRSDVNAPPAAANGQRAYLSVHFACCGVYQRVYQDRDAKTYHGRCPRCATPVKFVVGEGGTSARSFIVR